MTTAIRTILDRAIATLADAGAQDEALAEYVPPRRVRLIPRPATMIPQGRAWRLGILLLGRDGRLFEQGETVRVLEPGRPTWQSSVAEERREYRIAALRAKYTIGETVNFAAPEIDLDTESLRLSTGALFLDAAGIPRVRWTPTAPDDAAIPLADYLADRVALLAQPAEGDGTKR